MPRRDGTGPKGLGSGTGKRRGFCSSAGMLENTANQTAESGFGRSRNAGIKRRAGWVSFKTYGIGEDK